MSTITHAYNSGGQNAKEGLFSNLVTLSRADGHVDAVEAAMLERVALRLSLTPEQAKDIIKHPEEYPMTPPVSKEERFERLIQFASMAFADGVIDESEEKLIGRFGVALGFDFDDVKTHLVTIIEQMKANTPKDEILKSLM
ncbi:MAG: hypothetical protein QNK23_09830 [Crocinitomicaceae bacterium]|nr:hypothetical protein [Crocinitomicaceae bacterium]